MRLSTGQRRVEMLKDYLGLRAGHAADLDAGVADVLVHRGFAKYAEAPKPERAAEEPPPIPKPERAVKQAKEQRVVRPDAKNSADDRTAEAN